MAFMATTSVSLLADAPIFNGASSGAKMEIHVPHHALEHR
jgi:hypothetical protein